ncbi:MAG: Serine acetyltransferase [Ferruginibacter sp.]|nr:Serine acetyltransferase [Ferruginibacter sp.]
MQEKEFIQKLFQQNRKHFQGFPNKLFAEAVLNDLFHFLFTPYENKFDTEEEVAYGYADIRKNFSALLNDILKDKEAVKRHCLEFFSKLPFLYEQLLLDANVVLQFDPAAKSIEEVFVAYPGFYAIVVYRIAHQLLLQDIKVLPRLLSECGHSKTGIDIHPGAAIGHSFFIDHGTGIVIGETAIIGNDVKIYQGVTLGAMNVSKANAHTKRHPTIQDGVIIYSGATILGGETVVGRDSIIGGNVWLTHSVPPHSVVYHQSEVTVRDNNPLPEGLNFVI